MAFVALVLMATVSMSSCGKSDAPGATGSSPIACLTKGEAVEIIPNYASAENDIVSLRCYEDWAIASIPVGEEGIIVLFHYSDGAWQWVDETTALFEYDSPVCQQVPPAVREDVCFTSQL